jgi:vitamin-K-epoxide reductase (warfarin-sensitive)
MIYQLSMFGLILSIYALYVKIRSKNKKYKPLCDIKKNVSCSKAFSSKYGKLIILPNPLWGIIIYSVLIAGTYLDINFVTKSLIFLILLTTLYLMYLSYFKQKNFCLVCTGIYIVNILLFVFSF